MDARIGNCSFMQTVQVTRRDGECLQWRAAPQQLPPIVIPCPFTALTGNECQFLFIDVTPLRREAYLKFLCTAVARLVVKPDGSLFSLEQDLNKIFIIFHNHMLKCLKRIGSQEPSKTLQFWKTRNEKPTRISAVPFNFFARECLSSQA